MNCIPFYIMEKYDEKAITVLARAIADTLNNARYDYEGFIQKTTVTGPARSSSTSSVTILKMEPHLLLFPEINALSTAFPAILTGR